MVSQAALISAQVALDAAQADLHVAESNHALAKRALRQSELRAPFDGSVVARLLQPRLILHQVKRCCRSKDGAVYKQ